MNKTIANIMHDNKGWYNPFIYVAGNHALWAGLLIITLTSLIGYYSGVHFPGVLDGKIGWQGSFPMHLSLSVIAWLSMVIVLYPMARILSPSKVRLVDIAGTQALARTPMILSAIVGLPNVLDKVSTSIMYRMAEYMEGFANIEVEEWADPGPLSSWEISLAIFITLVFILATVWMVALMYHAYRVSSNLKGNRAGVSFTIGLLIAQAISNIAVFQWVRWVL